MAAAQTGRDPLGLSSLAHVLSPHAARHFDDNVILIDRHKVMLNKLNAVFKTAKFGESAADAASFTTRDESLFPGTIAQATRKRKRRVLFEKFFRRDGQPIGDLCRTIEDFENMIAKWTMKLARGSVPRGQFDPAKAGVAFGADDVAFFHARIMHAARNRSKTMVRCLN